MTKATFEPTSEQEANLELVKKNQLVKINSVSGSGKTSTFTYFANNLQVPSLYMAFNRTMAEEARRKFPVHVECLTVHALAYREIGSKYQHKLSRPLGKYVNVAATGNEIAKYFRIPDYCMSHGKKISKNYLGLLVKMTVAKFESSADVKITNNHFPGYQLKEIEKKYPEAKISTIRSLIKRYAEKLWQERIDLYSEVLATHDTYLKIFQLSKPKLTNYSVIYLDEAQDASDCILDIILSQPKNTKVIICGDERQAIYGWRGAINALQKVDCVGGELTKSFRYSQEIADVATHILRNTVKISGNEKVKSSVAIDFEDKAVDYDKPYTLLFRKNISLIYEAIELIDKGHKIKINIDLKDFVSMLTSAQELFHNNLKKVKHEEIIPYGSWSEFVEESKNDGNLAKLVKLVEESDVSRIISLLHDYDCGDNAMITLTTSHKAKGLEYNQVVMADDFPSGYHKGKWVGLSPEEENLLYVAATRARYALQVNSTVREYLDIYGKNRQREHLKCAG